MTTRRRFLCYVAGGVVAAVAAAGAGAFELVDQGVVPGKSKLDQLDESSILPAPRQIETAPKALTSGDFAALADVERVEIDYALAFDTVDAEIVESDDADAV